MLLVKKKADLRSYLDQQKQGKHLIGFAPTMGALHQGHISLIETSVKVNSITVCSIFVNPTQFNDPRDFEKYPITIENDIRLLESSGCDVLFLPSVAEVYGENGTSPQHYDLDYLETILEGKYRPGHFQGVCMVVHRLLEIVRPTSLYLGQKDYQQCMVINKLISLIGQPNIKLVICPTLREADGLAMSSRNMRLNTEERMVAPSIYQALQYIKANLKQGDLTSLKAMAASRLTQQDFKVDYVEIADAVTLRSVSEWDGDQELVALAAAFLHEVRLIDNLILS